MNILPFRLGSISTHIQLKFHSVPGNTFIIYFQSSKTSRTLFAFKKNLLIILDSRIWIPNSDIGSFPLWILNNRKSNGSFISLPVKPLKKRTKQKVKIDAWHLLSEF